MRETLLIKHSSCCFFLPKQSVLVEFILAHIKYWLKHISFSRTLWQIWTETLLIKHSSRCFFSTKTKCFGRIFPCTYWNIDWNTFLSVELYKSVTETLLIKYSSCCFLLQKHFVLVEFILAHIKILTETHLFW